MKLYLDTSVYGGYYDDEFLEDTRSLFDCINEYKIQVITSEMVIDELAESKNPLYLPNEKLS